MSWKPPRHFNSPQATYPTNVAPRQQYVAPQQQYHNGAVGYNQVHSPAPNNLHNSAVLRMLKEQEDEYIVNDQVTKEVVWPPPEEEGEDIPDSENYTNSQHLENSDPYSGYPYRKPIKKFEPPPATITLRDSPPISQVTAPVYKAQPAADTLKGGVRMRGDQKWPPPEYKIQAEKENEERIQIARGPLFRPRKVKKDYTSFFAQNALPNTYPGYKAPPGTQHYPEESTEYTDY